MRSFSTIAIILALLSAFFYYLDSHLESFYIFTPQELHGIAKRAVDAHGDNTRAVVDSILDDLRQLPAAKYLNWDEKYIFNNAGGAMGGMYIIHASVTEYLLIFGTAVGTEGHTGRHTADDYFHIIKGTQTAYSPGTFEPEVYPSGSVHHLRRGTVKQYKMDSACFALEYARGWIPPMVAFGLADGFTSTLDLPTLWDTCWVTGREMVLNLLRFKI